MKQTFISLSCAGANRAFSKDTRRQAYRDEHAEFIDNFIEEGFIQMGGPLVDEGGAMLIVNAEDEQEVREKLKDDPWYRDSILKPDGIKRW